MAQDTRADLTTEAGVISNSTTRNSNTRTRIGTMLQNIIDSCFNILTDLVNATGKTTPVDADLIPIADSAASNAMKKLTWANLKATLKAYFDTLYQEKLVSGTNIRTINSQSLLGSGNIVISGGSAAWGGITGTLSDQTDLQNALNAKQNTLVSGTNIKTVNSASILASGDLPLFNKSTDDTDDITEGATNKFLSGATIQALPAPQNFGVDSVFPFIDTDLNLSALDIDGISINDAFTGKYQPIAVSATVPANGTLPNGRQVLVVNNTVGRELYVGDASNNPVPACGYRQYVATLSQIGTNAPTAAIEKNTLGVSVSYDRVFAGQPTYNASYPSLGKAPFVFITNAYKTVGAGNLQFPVIESASSTNIQILTVNASNSAQEMLSDGKIRIEIRVYV